MQLGGRAVEALPQQGADTVGDLTRPISQAWILRLGGPSIAEEYVEFVLPSKHRHGVSRRCLLVYELPTFARRNCAPRYMNSQPWRLAPCRAPACWPGAESRFR